MEIHACQSFRDVAGMARQIRRTHQFAECPARQRACDKECVGGAVIAATDAPYGGLAS